MVYLQVLEEQKNVFIFEGFSNKMQNCVTNQQNKLEGLSLFK